MNYEWAPCINKCRGEAVNSQTSLRCLVIWETSHSVPLLLGFGWLNYTAV